MAVSPYLGFTQVDANQDQKEVTINAADIALEEAIQRLGKGGCRVATTVNGTLASAYENGDTVDGVTLATGDRILIKDQSTGAENGIYIVEATGAPTRDIEMDADADIVLGATISVLLGDVNARTIWMHTAGATIAAAKTFEKVQTGSVGYIPLSLGSLRDLAANEISTHLDDTTTPSFERINGATDKGLRVLWGTSNNDEVAFPEVPMPPDFDETQDITIHLVAEMSGATDSPTIDVQVFDSSGDTEMGGATAAITNTRAEFTVTITAADITGHPLGWLSISLVPVGAHATDTLALFAAWIEYVKKTTG
jgi:hypothetical protein